MKRKVSLDKAGRVVLPKHLRDKLRLEPGDELLVDDEGEQITLRPVRPQAALRKNSAYGFTKGSRATIPSRT
jgi:AbrB family looped-hinge helix DNA binding protein